MTFKFMCGSNFYETDVIIQTLLTCRDYKPDNYFNNLILFQIGVPGKSSKAGAMMLILPNTMGICVYSPNIDQYGNSVRGLKFCEELVRVFNFHRYDNSTRFVSKLNPRRIYYESKGDTIVSLLYAASEGDLDTLRR